MVSNLVVRNKRTGYVSFVAKARVRGDPRTVEYICGLGNMDQVEFKHFQQWAHSIKDQQMRRDRVLACPMVVEEGKIVKGKVATAAQKKTTVKRAPKKVKEGFPEPLKAIAIGIDKEKARREYEKRHGIPHRDKPTKYVESKGAGVTYKIDTLTRAQELEAEIKTLKGNKADKKLIREREQKIKSLLGKKYKTCREVAIAANKGDVFIDDSL